MTARAVLVFGEDTRSFLAVVRSLGRQGLRVHAAPFSLRAPALQSRYIAKVHRVPYYLGDGAAWLQAVQQLVVQHDIGYIVACEERSLLPLLRHQDAFGDCVIALPNAAAFAAYFDKLDTHRLADRCDVPAPRALPAHRHSNVKALETLGYPMACKWRRSYDWPDIYARTKVAIVRDRAALQAWLAKAPVAEDVVFVESFCPGFGLGVSVLCDRGQVLQAFEHHRVSEMEGSSYYRISRPVDPGRLAAVQRLAADVLFTGIAMFEFKHDPCSGRWWLLEVNARPWGSLPLPLAAGVDFPHGLYRLLVDGTRPAPVAYADGVRARNLLADLQQTRMQVQATAGVGRKLAITGGWLAGLPRVLGKQEHWDTWTRDDPRPAYAEFAQLGQAMKAKLRRALRLQHGSAAAPSASAAAASSTPSTSAAPRQLQVMFLCLGNICRSPYAEHRAAALAQATGAAVQFTSAGTLPRNRRPSPPAAVAAAGRRGLDLSAHRSTAAEQPLMDAADLIVYFDDHVLQACLDRFPEQAHKLVHIAALTPAAGRPDGAAGDVVDPFGEPEAAFDRTYTLIDQLLGGWPLLQARQPLQGQPQDRPQDQPQTGATRT